MQRWMLARTRRNLFPGRVLRNPQKIDAVAARKKSNEHVPGNCLCGAVELEIDFPAFWAWHDHSAASRRAHGAAYATYIGCWRKHAGVVKGQRSIARFEDANTESTRSFCSRCGTPLLYERKRSPSSLKHRSDRAAKPANHPVASAETLNGSVKLAAGERRILTALAQYPEGRSKVQVAVLTGYAAGGGGFNNYLGALRSQGLIQGDGDKIRIAEAGIRALGSWEPLPTGSALVDYWRNRLGKAERLILETLTHAYPVGLNKEEVAARAGYEAIGGGFNNALGRLRTLELVQGRGELKASDNLFDSSSM